MAVAAAVVAGCSDDGGRRGGGSTDTPTTPATSAAADPAADAAAAARINLTAADLGAAWSGTPPQPSTPDDEALERELYACLGAEPTDEVGDDVSSQDFANPAGLQISSSVDFVATPAAATAELVLLSGPKAQPCLQASLDLVLRQGLAASGGTIGTVTLTRDRALEVVAGSVAHRLTTSVTAIAQTVPVTGNLAALVRGRAGVTVVAFGIGAPVPNDVFAKALTAVATRADAETKPRH